MNLPAVPDTIIDRLLSDMDNVGYGALESYLSDDQIAAARSFLQQEVAKHHDQYFMYNGYDKIQGTILHGIGQSPEIRRVFEQLLEKRNLGRCSMEHPYAVARCLKGQSGLKKSYKFHFDAYTLTMLVPIVIPTSGGKTGDLLIYPNLRGIRSNAVVNMVEKFVYQNRLTITAMRELIRYGLLRPKVVKLVPGNVYFFWGYQSLHANEPCEVDALRATMIYHFGQPHRDSSLVKLVERRNQRRNQRQMQLEQA